LHGAQFKTEVRLKYLCFIQCVVVGFLFTALVSSSLHPGLQTANTSSTSQENTVAAIVQRAAAEAAAARFSRQNSAEVNHLPLQLPVSSVAQVPRPSHNYLSIIDIVLAVHITLKSF